jgi:hypothetical protein
LRDIIKALQTFNFKLTMSYKEQFIWKRAVQLAIHYYKFTNLFPNSELYGLTCFSVVLNLLATCRSDALFEMPRAKASKLVK